MEPPAEVGRDFISIRQRLIRVMELKKEYWQGPALDIIRRAALRQEIDETLESLRADIEHMIEYYELAASSSIATRSPEEAATLENLNAVLTRRIAKPELVSVNDLDTAISRFRADFRLFISPRPENRREVTEPEFWPDGPIDDVDNPMHGS